MASLTSPDLEAARGGAESEGDADPVEEEDEKPAEEPPKFDSTGRKVTAQERLDALLKQTAQFSQFVRGQRSSPDGEQKKPTKRQQDQRMAEEVEDKEMVDAEMAESVEQVRLLAPPSNIVADGGRVMRDYQLEALNWLIKLHDGKINGILADEMGLGKTLEAISLLAYLRESRNLNGPHLVIAPKSTITNWRNEMKRWCPSINAKIFHGTKEERAAMRSDLGKVDVSITTYEIASKEKASIRRVHWEYLIIDEAHRIKNEQSVLSQDVRIFKCNHRLLITGTPLQNNLRELWALLNFLQPRVFNSHTDFESWFDVTQKDERDAVVKRLHQILRPFLLRRLKSDVEKALPRKTETKLLFGMSAMQRAWYTKILTRDMAALNSVGSSGKMRLLNIVMQLRKVCNHPYLFNGAEPGPPYCEGEHIITNSGKMILLDKLLIRLKKLGSRVLIFSQMTRCLDILEDYCIYRQHEYCRIDGQTKQIDRDEAMEVFNSPGSSKFVFLLSTRAGGLGINLQTADVVVLYDSDWNPQMDLQAQDRAHRIGQKKPVHVYRFVTEGTVEEKIVERATRKLWLDATVIRQGRLMEQDRGVSAEELQKMVRFGADVIFQGKEATFTEEEIDAIISRGEKMTGEEKDKLDKLKQNSGFNLANFSLVTDEEDRKGLYEFEGQDFTSLHTKRFKFIEPPKRERKPSLLNLAPLPKKPSGPREFKPTTRFDHQFFNVDRLRELEQKEWNSRTKLKAIREKKKTVEKEKAAKQKEKEDMRLKSEADDDAAEDSDSTPKSESSGKGKKRAKVDETDAQEVPSKKSRPKSETDEKGKDDPPGKKSGSSKSESDDNDGPTKKGNAKAEDKQKDSPSARRGRPSKAEAAKAEAQADDSDEPLARTAKSGKSEPEDSDEPPAKKGKSKTESKKKGKDKELPLKEQDKESKKRKAGTKEESPARRSHRKRRQPEMELSEEERKALKEKREHEQEEREAGCLTEAEKKEKSSLESAGFGSWSRKHFQSYLRACEKWGRKDISKISQSVDGKTPAEVKSYHSAFWQRYEELTDHDKHIKQIERGEQRIKKSLEIQRLIDKHVKEFKEPFDTLTIPYATTQKVFSEQEDRFLFVMCAQKNLGWGNWEELKQAVRNSWSFRFDWFMKSRTAQDLSKRCDYLVKQLERDKEKDEVKPKSKKAKGRKRKSPAKPSRSNKKAALKGTALSKSRKTKETPQESEESDQEEAGSGGRESSSEEDKSKEEGGSASDRQDNEAEQSDQSE